MTPSVTPTEAPTPTETITPTPTETPATPTPTSTFTPTPTLEAITCGGITGAKCPSGYTCQNKGNYPDATGTCVPVSGQGTGGASL